jgi:hypothetical protein
MMGYTVFDYEGPDAFTYMNPEKKANQNKPGMYWDEQKGMYVLNRDPETGEEIPEDQVQKPLVDPKTAAKKRRGRALLFGALAVGGFFLLNR